MKKVLVTGVAGFIGSKVAEFLLEKGDNVVGIDNLNDYYSVNLKKYRLELLGKYKSFEFHLVDIEKNEQLETLFSKYDFRSVFNLAARAGVRYSLENPWIYFRTNAEGTLNLLEQMKDHNVGKFILASTSSLYAGLPMPFKEDLPVNTPISPYAASKKAAEMLAYTYHKQYGIDVSILRYFTVFGPLGRPDMAPYNFVKCILENKPIILYGDGTQARDFTYIDDIALGTVLAEKKIGYEIVNLGGGNLPIPINQFISWIEEITGKTALIVNKPVHSADMKETWADISKANLLFDWSPKVSTYKGIKMLVEQMNNIRF